MEIWHRNTASRSKSVSLCCPIKTLLLPGGSFNRSSLHSARLPHTDVPERPCFCEGKKNESSTFIETAVSKSVQLGKTCMEPKQLCEILWHAFPLSLQPMRHWSTFHLASLAPSYPLSPLSFIVSFRISFSDDLSWSFTAALQDSPLSNTSTPVTWNDCGQIIHYYSSLYTLGRALPTNNALD